jgi:hypothetical protein
MRPGEPAMNGSEVVPAEYGHAVFCPKCGQAMTQVRGSLTCVAGNMPLSPRAQSMLTDYCAGVELHPHGR